MTTATILEKSEARGVKVIRLGGSLTQEGVSEVAASFSAATRRD